MRRRGGGAERLLATVMFTDIVGSTERAAALGDRRWKQLVSRHNAIVRRLLKHYGGRELDTAGDGFFVMFERPAPAIDCGWSIVDALRPLDIEVRIAIHMGEVEVMGGKVGGIAVHVASRLLGLAKPGHIYVTGIVHDVVAGSDIRFADQGVHQLRGVPGEWRLFLVEQPAVDRALPVEEPPDPTAPRRAWTPLAAVLAVGGVVLIGAVVFVTANAPGAGPVAIQPNSVVRLDSAGRPLMAVSIGDPTGIAMDGNSPWVISLARRTVTRIDAGTGSVETIGLPGTPTGIAAGDGTIWITTGFGSSTGSAGIVRLTASNPTVSQPIALSNGVDGIAVGEGTILVINRLRNTLSRIEVQTHSVSREVEVGDQPVAVVAGEGAVWVANAIGRTITRLDPINLTVAGEVSLATAPYDVALGFGRLWVTSSLGSSVSIVDTTTNSLLQTVRLPGQPRGIAAGADAVWVALANGRLARIEPDSPNDVQTFELAGAVEDVAYADGSIWVSVRE